jgi:two-component system phosphate regulon response regulator PhoB
VTPGNCCGQVTPLSLVTVSLLRTMVPALRPAKRRVLVVEDENDIRDLLAFNLRQEGYEVVVAENGGGALDELERFSPELVVLDLMLPDISGIEVCKRIRSREGKPQPAVVMLTAKGEEIDRVVGFEVGADDYVVKPFSVRELVLRIRARLQEVATRGAGATPADPGGKPRKFVIGSLTIDGDTHRVLIDDEEVSVSLLEMQLLLHLAQAQGSVCSRRDLLTHVWNYSPGVTSRTVDTHVKRLRDKLGTAGTLIRTIRGVGYRLA